MTRRRAAPGVPEDPVERAAGPLVTADEMRAIDRATIDEIGIPAAVLMEHAGRAVADEVARSAPAARRVAVVCGAGNNGGDGFVCARWLRERGIDACVYLAARRPRPGGEAELYLAAYERLGGPVIELGDEAALGAHGDAIAAADVIVDALLGTGLRSDVTGHLARVIERLNAAPAPRVAVDVPSGLDADTGRVLGVAVRADRTVTLALPKIGLVVSPGHERAGELVVADIGIPRALAVRAGVRVELLGATRARALLPARRTDAHKGSFGHVLVLAGSPGRTGAALLCATGALRGGAGLVTLAPPPAARPTVEARVPEAMTATFDPEAPRAEALEALRALAEGKRALAWGPGMPTSLAAGELVRAAVPELDVPAVLDADALNHLAADPAALLGARAPIVLTPHPGEAARLLAMTIAEVQADRLGAARRLAATTGAIVILKGARTVIAAPEGGAAIAPTAHPALATGGTGDVLCGLVAALLAQGCAPFDAACLGAYVHGKAGELAARRRGGARGGLVARDVARAIPAVLAAVAAR